LFLFTKKINKYKLSLNVLIVTQTIKIFVLSIINKNLDLKKINILYI